MPLRTLGKLQPRGLRYMLAIICIYPLLSGLDFILNTNGHNAPAFDLFRTVMPLPAWGAVMLVFAGVVILLLTQDHVVIAWVLTGASIFYFFWFVMYALAVPTTGASWQAAALYLFVSGSHFAVAQTYAAGQASVDD